jgi:tetratricopeptide (TPR) repeat protein
VNAIRILANYDGWPMGSRPVSAALCWFASAWMAIGGSPAEGADATTVFRQRAKLEFEATRERYLADTNSVAAAWDFGRASFDLGEFAGSKAERETIATQGVAACRRAVLLAPESAPAHYYLGLNLGQMARVHLFKGLGIVSEMEKSFLAARKLDPQFDYAGADRALGLLYHKAPGWPISLGDNAKANRHLKEAIRLQPHYPGNRIALAEFLWETRRSREFAREWETIEELLPRAREEFTGPEWELSWVEWNQRLNKLRPHAKSPRD